MIRVLIFTFLTTFFLYANSVIEKVHNVVGDQEYQIHKSLITHLFNEESFYLSEGKIKYFNMFDTLQKNGLLNLRYQRPTQVRIDFKISGENKKGYKILSDLLHTLGYRYFFTTYLENNGEDLLWSISLKVEYMLDPVMFLRELKYSSCNVLDVVKKSTNNWYYEIDCSDAKLLKVAQIQKNEKVRFQKPLKPLFLDLEGAKTIQVISRNLNRWFPDVVFFDKNLNVLKDLKFDQVKKGLKLGVPEGTKYVKITDKYNLINIKRGLTLIVR
jgi:hypothetical protein